MKLGMSAGNDLPTFFAATRPSIKKMLGSGPPVARISSVRRSCPRPVLDVIFGRRAEYRRANAASCDSRKLGRAFAGGPLAHTFRRARPLLDFAKAAKARPRLLDLSGLCEALRTPTPPWTPTLPRQMMCATRL